MTATTLQSAFERISELPALYNNVVRIIPSSGKAVFEIVIENDFPDPRESAIVNEGTLAILVNYMRWVLNDNLSQVSLQFSHAPLSSKEDYASYLGIPMQFKQPKTALFLNLSHAQTPLHSADREFHQLLLNKLRQIQQRRSSSVADQVRIAIHEQLPTAVLTKARVADTLGFSEKTLDRRLAAENTSFMALVTDTRKELARYYLSDSHYRLDDIAQRLGYNDRAAFSKAYKKWTGKSPRG